MDSKKMYSSSLLLEDDLNWASPSTSPGPRPLSSGGRPPGAGPGTTFTTSSHNQHVDRDQDQALSCVSRETSHQDCARHRFIVWAAVKRNSSKRMTPGDRLRCPLIQCGHPFPDHESMLRHLAGCKHLASGEYLCYDHMRVEHFDDVKCKRCLGHPSKRRKMLSMAKNFFHTLGHKSKKDHAHGFGLDTDNVSLMPPPSYDSLGITPLNGNNPTELPSTEILEIDSVEVTNASPTAVTVSEGVIDPQALLRPTTIIPCLPELDSTGLSSNPFMEWEPTTALPMSLFPTIDGLQDGSTHPNPRPALQLNTYGLQGRRHAPRPIPRPEPPRNKGLSPSSSVRSTASTDTNSSTASNVTAASGVSSLVSPVSHWSGVWSMGSGMNTNLTTPIEALQMPDDAFAEALNYEEPCPNYLHDFFSELPAELPGSLSIPKISDSTPLDPLVPLGVSSSVNFPYGTDIVVGEDPTELVNVTELDVDQTMNPWGSASLPNEDNEYSEREGPVCCSEVKSMIESAWDALQEHIVSSMVKIQVVAGNPLAGQLRSMSTRTIATTGLRTLRTLLGGGQPSSAGDALCFVHLIYAFSLVVHEQGASHRAKELFLQSLSYTSSLPPNDRDFFTQLVYAIWQPPDITQADIRSFFALGPHNPLSRSTSLKGKSPESVASVSEMKEADSLLVAARNFLDELESSLLLGPTPDSLNIQTSELFSKHLQDNPAAGVHQAFVITVTYVAAQLHDAFADSRGLQDNINRIIQRVKNGEICSVRRVEIELLQAGKGCMPPARFFDDFVPQVRGMCDPIYQQHDAGISRRDDYHSLGINLVETIMPEFDSSSTIDPSDDVLEDDLDDSFDQYFNKLSPECVAETMTGIQTDFDHFLGLSSSKDSSSGGLQIPLVITTPPESGTSQLSSPVTMADDNNNNNNNNNNLPAQISSSSTSSSPPPPPPPTTDQQSAAQQQKVVEANSSCDLCGYRPKGDPQWFKGSMAKHKKLQHSTEPPKIYKCPYPGCSSQYRNRPDNLRQHQIEKGHWVDKGKGEGATQEGGGGAYRRPSKRKKVDVEGEGGE